MLALLKPLLSWMRCGTPRTIGEGVGRVHLGAVARGGGGEGVQVGLTHLGAGREGGGGAGAADYPPLQCAALNTVMPDSVLRYLFAVQAINALRVLLEQLYLVRTSSSCVTDGVRVDATSHHATTAAVGGRTQHIFTYRIRVMNLR